MLVLDDRVVQRSVIEGPPIALEPTLSIVPVLGWEGSWSRDDTWSVALEPLALILARPDGVTRLVLGKHEDDPDVTQPGTAADLLDESIRRQCVDAVFGPVEGADGTFRLPIRRASGEAERVGDLALELRVTIRTSEIVGEVTIVDGMARFRRPLRS